MKTKGTLIWNGLPVSWKHVGSSNYGHFMVTVYDKPNKKYMTFDNLDVSKQDGTERIFDFTKLPQALREGILDRCVGELNQSVIKA